ncbi:MAG: STAS domain-containing protein [Crocinitomicaceae bacterium]|nr:STAS domain-containing protein [Flavobacteriales bacterium]NQZ37568.1 STAS domain-containing protein [Crocinitomicaceae bacterium]
MSLTYDITIHDPVIVYTFNGKITTDEDYLDFEREVFDHLNQNYYRIVFNLTGLTHTNSSGIGFFMRTLTKSRIMGGDLVLTNIFGNVKKIFEIAKLTEVYTICENEAAGIEFFNTTK